MFPQAPSHHFWQGIMQCLGDAWIIKQKILVGNVHKQGRVKFSVCSTFNYN